jgi:capsid assembly protease
MPADQSSRLWALRPDEVVMAEAFACREAKAKNPLQVFGPGEPLNGSDFARVVDGVAIVPVRGLLVRKMSFWFWSYEEIVRDVALAQVDRNVRSILLDVDSGGGMAAGCQDAAEYIRASGPKPVEAFVGGMCASGAYWLASAAKRITYGSAVMVGSVGVVIEYLDLEPYFEKMGARMIRVVAEQSPNKRLDPGSAEGEAELQALVDATCAEFVTSVATNRGIGEAEVLDRFGQGLVFDGTEAERRGMVDQRATMDFLIAEMAARDPFATAVPAAAAQEQPMDWASLTLAALREHRPDLLTEATSEAVASAETAARAAGANAERARLIGIDEIAVDGHEDLVVAAKADGKTTPEALALQIVKAEKQAGTSHLSQRAAADAAAGKVDARAPLPPKAAKGGTTEAEMKAEWESDAELRAEFGDNFAAFASWQKANADGRARVLSRAN